MCLHSKKDVLKAVKSRLAKNGFILGYKVVKVDKKEIRSSCYNSYVWKSGWNASNIHVNGTENAEIAQDIIVNGGIHVYLNRRPAKNHVSKYSYTGSYYDYFLVVLPVMCFENDLIAAGSNNTNEGQGAVFSKVFVKNSDFAAAKAKYVPKKKKSK